MEFLSLEEVSSVKFSNVNIIGAPLQASVPGLWLTEGLIVEATNLDSLDATGGLTVYRDPKSEVSAINITVLNNPALKNLTVGVFGGNYNLLVAGNSPELVVDFNYFGNGWLNLSGCNNVTAYSVEQLDWATFDDNTFTSLDLPSLASVRNSFEIKSNLRLANLLLPKLEPARVIDVRDNADLHDLRVPSLLSVLESLNVSGALTSLSLPAFTGTDGDVFIESTADFDCSALEHLKRVVKGSYLCSDQASTHAPSGGSNNGASSGGASSREDKIGIGVGVSLGVAFTLSGIGLWWYRYRRRLITAKAAEEGAAKVNQPDAENLQDPELDGRPSDKLQQLPDELSTGEQRSELAPQHGVSELAT